MHGTVALPNHQPLLPVSFPLGRAWFVVFCSSAEMHWSKIGEMWDFPVVRRIEAAGFETFVPVERRKVVKNGRKREQITPVFGSYVFTRFDREADDWWLLKAFDPDRGEGIHGVHFVIRDHFGSPIRVPDKEIDRFRRAEAAGAFDHTLPRSTFAVGETVEIQEGPFAGLIAKVRSASANKRVNLLLDGLGRLEIEAEYLAKV